MRSLTFSEKLKGTTDAVVKKLKTLHGELASLEQDDTDTSSLDHVKKDLLSTSLLLHKDRGVKALTACCLADLLRLYAPDAPFTQAELRDMFQFFFRQLQSGLKRDASYYAEYFHLLESLSTVKSVVLVCDLSNADDMLLEIFRDFFAVVRRDLPRKVETYMADILAALIDECATLPSDVLELIMAQFMDRNATSEQPAFRLAVAVCTETSTKLQRHVAVYFADLLSSSEDPEDNLAEIKKAHTLLHKIHASVPSLLLTIIPQFEAQLTSSSVSLRVLATESYATLLSSGTPASQSLPSQFPQVWSSWLARRNDKSPLVRVKFIESTSPLFGTLLTPESKQLESSLDSKLLDPDPSVRISVCKLIGGLGYEILSHYITKTTLETLAGRGADRKPTVREAALKAIGNAFNKSYREIERNDPSAIDKFSWIPLRILEMIPVGVQLRSLVACVITEYILPLPTPEVEERVWTMRLLNIMKYLDEKRIKALLSLTPLAFTRPTPFETYAQLCVAFNGGLIDSPTQEKEISGKLDKVIDYLSSTLFSDPVSAKGDLKTFAKTNDQRLFKLLLKAFDVGVDVRSLAKSIGELIKKVQSTQSNVFGTIEVLIRRGSLGIVNTSSVGTFLERLVAPSLSQSQSQGASQSQTQASQRESLAAKLTHASLESTNAEVLLVFLSKHTPGVLESHFMKILDVLGEARRREAYADADVDDEGALTVLNPGKVESVCLRAIAGIVKRNPGLEVENDLDSEEFSETLSKIPRYIYSTSSSAAKFAARFLIFAPASLASSTSTPSEVIKTLLPNLSHAPPRNLVSHLSALVEFARWIPEVVEEGDGAEGVIKVLVKEVFMAESDEIDAEPEAEDGEVEEWAEDEELSDHLRAQILGIKFCRWRCLALANAKGKEKEGEESLTPLEIATPTLKMLMSLVDNTGLFKSGMRQHPKAMSRLRLQAGISLLHLSTMDVYANAISARFVQVGLIVQDTCFNVRFHFLMKLVSLLTPRKLPPRYNILPFLTVLDPEEDVKNLASSFVVNSLKKMTSEMRFRWFEMGFVRLLNFLAHHPDFEATSEEEGGMARDMVGDFARYINFYLDMVMTADNISLLYHLALKGKTVRDAESDVYSENFYIICEMAQTLIHVRAEQTHGLTIPSYPGKVKLPSDILRPMSNAAKSNEVAKKAWLSEEVVGWLREMGGAVKQEKKERERKPVVKRKAATNGTTRRPRKKRKSDHDADDDESDNDNDNDNDIDPTHDDEGVVSSELSELTDIEMEDAEESVEDDGEEQLGRGARGRAKAKAKRQAAKARRKQKEKSPSPASSVG